MVRVSTKEGENCLRPAVHAAAHKAKLVDSFQEPVLYCGFWVLNAGY